MNEERFLILAPTGRDAMLTAASEVAFLPPMSGG